MTPGRVRFALALALVLLLEGLSRFGMIDRFAMIPPSEILWHLGRILAAGEMWPAILKTLTNVAVACIAAVIVGVILGTLIHGWRALRETLDPLFAAYYAIPVYAFYPLFIVIFGLGDVPQVLIGFMLGLVAVIVNTLNGLDRVPRVLIKTARIQRLGPAATALNVALPYAVPYVFTGIKLAVAFAIAVSCGILIGFTLGLYRFAADVGEPVLVALYSIPKITLYPIVLLAFGIGMPAKIAFGAIHGIMPIAIFALGAVRNLNPVYLKAARVMRLPPARIAARVLLPAAIPEIFTAMRIGFSLPLVGTLLGEMFASQRGIGHLLIQAIGLHNVRMIMALTLLLVIIAVTASALLLAVDRRIRRRVL